MSGADRSSELQRIIADYKRSVHRDNAENRKQLIERHPDLADGLRAFFTSYDAGGQTAEFGPEQLESAPPPGVGLDAATLPPNQAAATLPPTYPANGAGNRQASASQLIDDYRLVRQLGQGGMGQVWEAENVETGRRVALKLLSADVAPNEEMLERFIREARLAAALSHPRSTFVFGAGEHHGQPYIVMELMPGQTLQDVIDREGPLPANRAVDYVLDLIEGLDAAHQLGVIHRDVKPSNCFLDGEGRVKVGDFGLSKSLVADTNLTRTGVFMGTPQYAAPEQVRGAKTDERTDMYAVGATLYSLIAKRGPFTGDAMAMIAQIVSDPPTPLRSIVPQTPTALDRIVARTLEKDPTRRYANLAQLRSALLPYATGGTTMADLWRRLAAYMLDVVSLSICNFFLGLLALAVSMGMSFSVSVVGNTTTGAMTVPLGLQRGLSVFGWLLLTSYFAWTEAIWGCGLGKRFMGLSVVTADGERPRLSKSYLRSFIIPGQLGLAISAHVLMMAPSGDAEIVQHSMIVPIAAMFFQMSFLLLCMTTMRARNGYRGVHELVSGTRVVRLKSRETSAAKLDIPLIAPVKSAAEDASFGPFQVLGKLGTQAGSDVFHAKDATLDRAVWIFASTDAEGPPDDSRQRIGRATRPYWLQGGKAGDLHWNAFESVDGSPLPVFLRQGKVPWQVARVMLSDLANELVAAMDDHTLPANLTLDQIWVVAGGRVKVLDAPLQALGSKNGDACLAAEVQKPRPASVLRMAVEQCTDDQILPDHVGAFLDELASRPDDAETLRWAADSLSEISDRPVELDWGHRLASLAVSMGTENLAYGLVALLMPSLLYGLTGLSREVWTFDCLLLSATIPFAVGWWLRGSPVFRLMQIAVRRKNGEIASGWQCGLRSLVAWSPAIGLGSILGFFMAVQLFDPENAQAAMSGPSFLMVFFAFSVLLILFVLGAIHSVVSPQCGIQDFFARTRLIRS